MPKFTFKCQSCDKEENVYTSTDTNSRPCKCGSTMDRQIPKMAKPIVKERVDSYTNVNVSVDNKEEIQERKLDHYWEVLVPRLVQQYPVEHCIQEGWMGYDDRNQLIVYTKPPHKR
jgi:transcription elongation factor Elf1